MPTSDRSAAAGSLSRRRLLQSGAALTAWPIAASGAALLAGCGGGDDAATPLSATAEPDVAVLYRPSAALSTSRSYPGFRPGTSTLAAGSIARPSATDPTTSDWGFRIPVDITFERDVEVVLRDGTRMLVDIYRPKDGTALPAIMGWSPYGKTDTRLPAAAMRGFGTDPATLSGLQRFEGPDPAWWCAQGYAVISPDPRGSFVSDGDIRQWGQQCADDGYDVVEWIAKRPWCNGKVGLTGNSWLGISQWWIASAQPPSLAAIAPWEALVDLYRDDVCRGGIPDAEFASITLYELVGRQRTEDTPAMAAAYPLMNKHWEGKRAPLEKVKVPAYVVASWTNTLHSPGSFVGFEGIASSQKWLRVHNAQEWSDYYANQDDLKKFFDHFLKGQDNGWTATPVVRLSIFDETGTTASPPAPGPNADIVNRAEAAFPLARTVYRPLFLDAAAGSLGATAATTAASLAYAAADNAGQALFTHTFTADTELTGYMMLRVWLQADGADDMDVWVQVRKLDAAGVPMVFNNPLAANVFPTSVGPWARHRVSHREVDAALSRKNRPYYTYRNPKLLQTGEIVPVEFELSPAGTQWRAGQQLQLSIAGFRQGPKVFPSIANQPPRINRGRHIVWAGGSYDSQLVIPVV